MSRVDVFCLYESLLILSVTSLVRTSGKGKLENENTLEQIFPLLNFFADIKYKFVPSKLESFTG